MVIWAWGTGHVADQVMKQYADSKIYDIKGFIDNNPEKQGRMYFGRMVYAPDILLEEKADRIIVLTDKFQEVYEQITQILKLQNIAIENQYFFYKESLLKRYKGTQDKELREITEYIKNTDLQVFNYKFTEQYKNLHPEIKYDECCELYYVMHLGKKMYFARHLGEKEAVEKYYINILAEQDKDSPHRYLDEQFQVKKRDVVVDIGVAEGNFALEVIDKVSKIYLIEADEGWVEALKETFRFYKDKVIIIQKYVTSINEGQYATLDYLINEPVNFIKMDIEGNEWDALLGAKDLILRSQNLRCAICAYHTDYDEMLITTALNSYGLQCGTTHGYMWFPFGFRNNYIPTKLVRGIVRGTK